MTLDHDDSGIVWRECNKCRLRESEGARFVRLWDGQMYCRSCVQTAGGGIARRIANNESLEETITPRPSAYLTLTFAVWATSFLALAIVVKDTEGWLVIWITVLCAVAGIGFGIEYWREALKHRTVACWMVMWW